MGKQTRIESLSIILTVARLNNPLPDNVNGIKNDKTEMCMWKEVVLSRILGNCFP